ncbi:LysR family transcriptional regulator [Pseudomonas veronii]|jgi:molybdate transport system regulatory protein|uniref:winged helix-turn-helix domain-containing protein n=1 Tax=Pseudomonas TaxID=286 RepID=UPI0011EF1D3A|nr:MULTISPECIES: winged helix-turn-helix domain-containing protein [Pseudomonas]KAA0943574.1 LysR family transcriptional regulator [Pseudomonas sp. ANT_H4]KAA0946120.1 LysR family transcriptional regulator [Pseudomonas sp. ANT_H14]NMX41862.1 LysR family transcriptional regulator [Pseudomonas veronii]URD45566.1 winged helix-turn-helix domain-containing protein [Pseudomonas sp. BYT-5]URK95675.1 winged helix-turn-helix domain-containing protein [Pseudomonas sp. BYT-1]
MKTLDLKIRLRCGDDIAIGPGKADLLAAIQEAGSISGAARLLGMSYRRAWLLVETMNRCFREPLVSTSAGGRHGGGTQLTATGEQVLKSYRDLCVRALAEIESHMGEITALLVT